MSDGMANDYLPGIGQLETEASQNGKIVLILDLFGLLQESEFPALPHAVQERNKIREGEKTL